MWDHHFKDSNVMLIISGSSMSFMEKEILSEKNPLYGRTTGILRINELEFEVAQYNAIIESIALGDTKMNDIYQKTGIEKTKLPYYLGGLIDLGIVRKEYPSTIKVKEQAKRRSGIYKIDNSYFRFYYAFVYPYISELMEGNIDIILEDVIMERLPMFTSIEFEKVAISYIRQLVKNRQAPIRPVRIGRWWNKDIKIDIVAYDINGSYLFGECKWRNEKMNMKVLDQLKHKAQFLEKTVGDKYYILFSKSGFTKDLVMYSKEAPNLMLIDYSGTHQVIAYYNYC